MTSASYSIAAGLNGRNSSACAGPSASPGERGREITGVNSELAMAAPLPCCNPLSDARGDHINLVRGDNRIENLRCASQSQNMANKSRKKEYASPYKGVYKRWGRNGRWGACIGHNKKRIYLGYFSTPEEAQAAYLEAATRLFGEFARAA